MAKIIVERPRRGHRLDWARPGRSDALEDDDGAPYRQRTPQRTRPLRTKSLNENLAPLERYLGKQVGRPWRKVYSEISANLKPASTVQQHVRDHVEDFVAVKTYMVDGVVHAANRFGAPKPLSEDWRPYFVHPRTGLLRRNPHARR